MIDRGKATSPHYVASFLKNDYTTGGFWAGYGFGLAVSQSGVRTYMNKINVEILGENSEIESGANFGVAIDYDNDVIFFYKEGKKYAQLNHDKKDFVIAYGGGASSSGEALFNFGATPFRYSPPRGFLPYQEEDPSKKSVFKKDSENYQYNYKETFKNQLYFNGSNSYIDFNDPYNNNTFTLEAWAKWEGGDGYILTNIEASGYSLMVNKNGDLRSHLYIGSSYKYVISEGVVPIDKWTHLAVTYDNEKARQYVNGVLTGEESISGNIKNSSYNMSVGNNIGRNRQTFFKGYISDARVWKVARTQKQIQDSMFKLNKEDMEGIEARALSGNFFTEHKYDSEKTYDDINDKDYSIVRAKWESGIVEVQEGWEELGEDLSKEELLELENKSLIYAKSTKNSYTKKNIKVNHYKIKDNVLRYKVEPNRSIEMLNIKIS